MVALKTCSHDIILQLIISRPRNLRTIKRISDRIRLKHMTRHSSLLNLLILVVRSRRYFSRRNTSLQFLKTINLHRLLRLTSNHPPKRIRILLLIRPECRPARDLVHLWVIVHPRSWVLKNIKLESLCRLVYRDAEGVVKIDIADDMFSLSFRLSKVVSFALSVKSL